MARLETVIYEARQDVELLVAGRDRQMARCFLLAKRGNAAGRAAEQFAAGLAGYRGGLDAENSNPPKHARRPDYLTPWATTAHLQPPVGRGYGPDLKQLLG